MVFVFKQKTAYELRISDWSSDVCSSDLRAQVQLLGGDQREAFAEIEAHLPAEHAARAGTGAVGLFGAVLKHVAQQVEVLTHANPLVGRGYVPDVRHSCRCGRRRHSPDLRHRLMPRPPRSEEHTSELQSLMRISY